MRKIILSLAAVAALGGCGTPQIHYSQLAALDKGLTPAEVVAVLKLQPSGVLHAQAGGRDFQFYQYRMSNGLQADRYLVGFEGGKLIYWGYLDEFRKHPDKALATAAAQAALSPAR